MAFATDNTVYSDRQAGRVLVSGGTSIAEKIVPDEDLPTLYTDVTHTPFWEVVLTKGTIVAFKMDTDGRILAVPCDSTAQDSTAFAQGVLQLDAFRPFEKGDRAGISMVTSGYIEVPLIKATTGSDPHITFDNSDLRVGDFVKSDNMGRFVKWDDSTDDEWFRIGQVKFVEFFGDGVVPATFDYGFLQYMQLPYEEFQAALLAQVNTVHDAYAGAAAVQDLIGVRGNLRERGVYGAARINLFNM